MESKKKTKEIITNKIILINKINLLQKFVAECYNHICDKSIKIISNKIYKKKVYVNTEYKFH